MSRAVRELQLREVSFTIDIPGGCMVPESKIVAQGWVNHEVSEVQGIGLWWGY